MLLALRRRETTVWSLTQVICECVGALVVLCWLSAKFGHALLIKIVLSVDIVVDFLYVCSRVASFCARF